MTISRSWLERSGMVSKENRILLSCNPLPAGLGVFSYPKKAALLFRNAAYAKRFYLGINP
jgi:hypothetical protein